MGTQKQIDDFKKSLARFYVPFNDHEHDFNLIQKLRKGILEANLPPKKLVMTN